MTTQDLQQIDKLLQKRLKNFTTKDGLRNFATKDDLKNLATKDDLQVMERKLLNKMGKLGKEILDAVSLGTVAKINFKKLEERVDKSEKDFQTF